MPTVQRYCIVISSIILVVFQLVFLVFFFYMLQKRTFGVDFHRPSVFLSSSQQFKHTEWNLQHCPQSAEIAQWLHPPILIHVWTYEEEALFPLHCLSTASTILLFTCAFCIFCPFLALIGSLWTFIQLDTFIQSPLVRLGSLRTAFGMFCWLLDVWLH